MVQIPYLTKAQAKAYLVDLSHTLNVTLKIMYHVLFKHHKTGETFAGGLPHHLKLIRRSTFVKRGF